MEAALVAPRPVERQDAILVVHGLRELVRPEGADSGRENSAAPGRGTRPVKAGPPRKPFFNLLHHHASTTFVVAAATTNL